jgi:phytoene dehydrogenase-like protein
MNSSVPDAIVVGAGPNGLAAAIELARAGKNVTIYEAAPTVGGGTRSAELTEPGFVHDVCSAIHPLLLASPFFVDLMPHLELETLEPSVQFAHPLPDGSAAVVVRSVEETAASLGPDGRAYRSLMQPFVDNWQGLVDGVLAPLRVPRHPLIMARFGLHAIRSVQGLTRRFESDQTRALFAGVAAHSMLALTKPLTGGVALFLGLLAHSVGWPCVRGGSQRIADALARHLEGLGGTIVTDHEVTSLGELPAAKATLFDVTPRQLIAIAGDRLPDRYRSALGRFRYGPGVFKIDWALSEPVPWRAEECRLAGTVHVGGTFEEVAASEAETVAGRHAERPYVLVAQQSLMDESRAPEGKHTLWAYSHVPSGSTEDMTEPIEAQIERFAPGFRDTIAARTTSNATEIEAYNANYIGGDINVGIQDLMQHFGRPVVRANPYTTPNKSLFLCSSSTPPGGGVHGMCGRYAARAALRGVLR